MLRRTPVLRGRSVVLIAVSILLVFPALTPGTPNAHSDVASPTRLNMGALGPLSTPPPGPGVASGSPGHTFSPGLGAIEVGTAPDAVAYSGTTHDLYVANRDSSNVSVLNGTTDQVMGSIIVGNSPSALAYDRANASIIVANSASSNVSVINSTGIVVRSIPVGSSPQSLAYDARDGDMFVLNASAVNDTVTPISSSGVVQPGFPVIPSPGGLAFDPSNGLLYVTGYTAGSIVAYNVTTGTAVATVRAGTDPTAITYDPLNGNLYAVNYRSNNVTVLNGTTNAVAATIPVGSGPRAIAVDTDSGVLYVANSQDDTVMFINGTSNQVYGWAHTGSIPVGVAFDPLNGNVYVANLLSGTVSVIATLHPSTVTFAETGLPAGKSWSMTLGGVTQSATVSSITFTESNGTYPYQISPIQNYVSTPLSGDAVIAGIPQNVPILFQGTYLLTFDESGLPSGSNWYVVVNGTTVSANGAAASLPLPNGTYYYTFQDPVTLGAWERFLPTPPWGQVTMAGNALLLNVSYLEQFYLNTSTNNATYGNARPFSGWFNASTSVSLVASAQGDHVFVRWAGTGPGSYTGSGNPQTLVLNASVNETAIFSDIHLYSVTFVERGLPSGTLWSVEISGPPRSSTTDTLLFSLANGTYGVFLLSPITTSAGTRYVSDAPGTVTVSGTALSVSINYSVEYDLTVSAGPPSAGLVSPRSGWERAGTSVPLNFTTAAGFLFVAWAGNGNGSYSGTQRTPVIQVKGPITEVAEFETLYPVVFNQVGLPPGTSWSVTVNGTIMTSISATLDFSLPDGKYSYSIANVPGYTSTPTSGTLYVSTSIHPTVTVTYTRHAVPTQKILGLPEWDWILFAVVAVTMAGVILAIRNRKIRGPGNATPDEASHDGEEENPQPPPTHDKPAATDGEGSPQDPGETPPASP